jgi:predicted ArsR family transcriptional regulator
MYRKAALQLAVRCARDSMPPLRLAIIDDLAANPDSSTPEVRKRLDKPRNTVDRQLQALHMLGVLTCREQEYSENGRTRWFYSLAEGINPDALNTGSVPDLLVSSLISLGSNKSGTDGYGSW